MARRLGFTSQVATPGRLLDFGCGDGGFLAAAGSAGWEAVGVEMKPDDARTRGLTVVDQVHEARGPFDVITLWHALEHVRSPRQTLESLLPLLRPGGHMLIAVPNRSSLQACCSDRFGSISMFLGIFRILPRRRSRGCSLGGG